MTFASRETSTYQGTPFELYAFQTSDQSWRHTSGDVTRTYLTNVYTPETILRTEMNQNQEARAGSIKVTIPKTHPIALLFYSYIPSTPLFLTIYRGHDGEAESETITNFTGRVASATFGDECELLVVPSQDALRRHVPGPKYQRQCNWMLYGHGCAVDRSLFKLTGTVTAVSGDSVTVAIFSTKPDGWLNNGFIEKGLQLRMILSHTGNTVRLFIPMADLAIGDTVNAYAGCNRSESDCNLKFNNLSNFSGHTHIPTRNPFDGLEHS